LQLSERERRGHALALSPRGDARAYIGPRKIYIGSRLPWR